MRKFLHEFATTKEYTGQEVLYLHHKFDGHRVTACKQPIGSERQLILYTRSQTDLFPDIFQKAEKHGIWPWVANLLALPAFSSIDGELYVSGRDSSYVKTAIKECDPALKFIAFAVPWMDKQRRYTDPLEWAMRQASQFKIHFAPFIKLDAPQPIDKEEWAKKTPIGAEGWVAKRHHYQGWYKIKPRKTIDLIVTGFKKGNGKYADTIGSLVCSAFDARGQRREICLASGMTDEERRSFSEADIGRVCEIEYQKVLSLGRLRHPIFKRWRDDEKKPFECTLAQEPELLKYWSERGD